MEASRQIENLIYTYAERIDAGDLEGVAELFRHAKIVAPAHDAENKGYDEVLKMYQESTRIYADTGTPKTKHVTTNVIIEVAGDKASARANYTVIQATDALPLQVIISGRYHDEFVCEDGQWRFAKRAMFVDQLGDLSAHLLYGAEGLA